MKRAFLTLALIATLTSPVFVNAAADTVVDKGAGLIGSGISATTKFLGFDQVGTLLDALRPDTKNCSYVGKQLYQPFSGIDNKFPGAETLGVAKGAKDPRVTCISVTGGTEGLLRMLFTAGIAVVIALSVIGIAVSGLRYMTEEAVGKKGEAKRKLQNSLIGLFLGLMSYTVLYAVNRQLTNFAFNPVDLDPTGAVAKGAAEAAQAAKLAKLGVGTAGIEGTMTPVQPLPSYVPNGTGGYTNIVDQFNSPIGPSNTVGLLQARVTNINNAGLDRASADGFLSLNGITYRFRSGGGGNGYLPFGQYTITNGRLRNTPSSMTVDGFGYSFDLSDAFDARTQAQRELLRIHPDGGGPGTIGCIGIQGDRATQERFYSALKRLLEANGGRYTIRVGN